MSQKVEKKRKMKTNNMDELEIKQAESEVEKPAEDAVEAVKSDSE